MQLHSVDAASQVALRGCWCVSQPDEYASLAGGEGHGAPCLDRPPVGLAVAVGVDRSVDGKDEGEMADGLVGGLFRRAVEADGAISVLAGQVPMPGFKFAEGNRVVDRSVDCLQRDHSTALLLRVVEPDPDFECACGDGPRNWRCGEEAPGGQYQLAVFDASVSVEASVELADRVAGCVGEVPSRERFRSVRAVFGISPLIADPLSDGRFEVFELRFKLFVTRIEARGGVAGAMGLGRAGQVTQSVADSGQGRRHPVVLFLSDRVELVVVTACTVDRQAEKRLADDADDVFEFVLPDDSLHGQALLRVPDFVPGSCDQEPGGDSCTGVVRLQDVSGELPCGEPMVGHVGIQGVSDPVAVAPRVGSQLVPLKTLAFTVADDVEPVSGPVFAEVRVRQQSVDQLAGCVGSRVGDEAVDGVGVGEQAEQVDGESACQHAA